jgi:ATP-dependent RNA helicase DeaD
LSNFSDLGLSQDILKALPELGIETPSEIQEKAIPQLLNAHTDFIGLAQTGTGKTAAFGLPLIEAIDMESNHTQALVLAPTRELGQQIAGQVKAFSKYKKGLGVTAVYGGANIMGQIKELRRSKHIIIATPGRLIDLVKRRAIDLSKITHLVLDEADEMLNMGFKEDIDEILTFAPDDNVTWLFSATMSKDIRRIVKNYMENPLEVQVGSKDEVNKNISHKYVFIKASDKQEVLRRFIDIDPNMRGIIFCRTKMDTQDLSADLRKMGYAIDAIHGDLTQNARDKVMGMFKSHTINLLAATDVAARGIDVKDITHVIHYSMPEDPEYYTHRSGRTARAGQLGTSLSLATRRDLSRIKQFSNGLKIEFTKIDVPNAGDIQETRIQKWAENLTNIEDDKVPADVLTKVEGLFEGFTKEQLIQRLVAIEMSKLGSNSSNRDLNDSGKGGGRDDNSRSKRTDRRRNERSDGRRSDRGERSGERNDSRRGGERSDRYSDRKESRRNERSRNDRSDRNRSNRDESKAYEAPKGDTVRFMMNIGKKEHVNKANLLRFICDESGLKKNSIGTIDVQDSRSYFEVESGSSNSLPKKFKDIDINGRLLEVTKA